MLHAESGVGGCRALVEEPRYTLQGRLPPTVAQTIVLPLIPPNIMPFPAGYAMLRLYAASSLPRGHPFSHGHPFAKTPLETQHPLWDALSGIGPTSHAAYENPPRAAHLTFDPLRVTEPPFSGIPDSALGLTTLYPAQLTPSLSETPVRLSTPQGTLGLDVCVPDPMIGLTRLCPVRLTRSLFLDSWRLFIPQGMLLVVRG
jgi:hypothetical protein